MQQATDFNAVFLMGQVNSEIQIKDKGLQFSLKNDKGTFFIKANGYENITVAKRLVVGQQISILGELYSYVGKRCQSHHVYIQAKTIIPHEDSPGFMNLLTILGAQALYQSRINSHDYTMEIYSESGRKNGINQGEEYTEPNRNDKTLAPLSLDNVLQPTSP